MIYHPERLLSVDKKLITLIENISDNMDIMVVCGFRNSLEQNKAFREGKSKLKFPHSAHNITPCKAVDVAPMIDEKIDWSQESCDALRAYIDSLAKSLKIGLKPKIIGDALHIETLK